MANDPKKPEPPKAATPLSAVATKTRKPRVSVVPEGESKSARFRRVGSKRMTRAIKALAQVERMGRSRSSYEYTPEQASKILQSLTDAVAAIKIAFAGSGKATQELFDL